MSEKFRDVFWSLSWNEFFFQHKRSFGFARGLYQIKDSLINASRILYMADINVCKQKHLSYTEAKLRFTNTREKAAKIERVKPGKKG